MSDRNQIRSNEDAKSRENLLKDLKKHSNLGMDSEVKYIQSMLLHAIETVRSDDHNGRVRGHVYYFHDKTAAENAHVEAVKLVNSR